MSERNPESTGFLRVMCFEVINVNIISVKKRLMVHQNQFKLQKGHVYKEIFHSLLDLCFALYEKSITHNGHPPRTAVVE